MVLNEDLNIREFNYSLEDARSIKYIDSLTFRDCGYDENTIIQIAKDSKNRIYLAEINDKIVGFISLIAVQTLHYKGLWVDLIAVHPEHQGNGIGKKLLQHGKKYGNILGVDIVSGLVANENKSSSLAFKKQDYKEIDKDYRLYIYSK